MQPHTYLYDATREAKAVAESAEARKKTLENVTT